MHDDILIKDWPGLDDATKRLLLDRYLGTLKGFLWQTTEENLRDLGGIDGLSTERIAALREDAQRHLDALPEVVVHGILDPYFETGTEGVCWSVYEDGKTGYEGLHQMGGGEHLRVIGPDGKIIFEGFIEPDPKKGWTEYPGRPGEGLGQPVALGMWIHWTQAGWEPDAWAQLFLDHHRAVLTYNKKRN